MTTTLRIRDTIGKDQGQKPSCARAHLNAVVSGLLLEKDAAAVVDNFDAAFDECPHRLRRYEALDRGRP